MSIRVSEVFYSLEGEGPYTGYPTLFIRFFGCNFTCAGFGKETATALREFYPVVTSREELKKQEFKIGCDSAYSWHPTYKTLAVDHTVESLAEEIVRVIGDSKAKPILCFTGGEPMLYQKYLGAIWNAVHDRVSSILIETNGSLKVKQEFWDGFNGDNNAVSHIIWSVSPKLSNSGEPWEIAINPSVLKTMLGERYLKFVSDGSKESLDEVERALREYSEGNDAAYILLRNRTWLMPEGSTLEQQQEVQRKVAEVCMKENFKFCARVHVWVFNNEIGT